MDEAWAKDFLAQFWAPAAAVILATVVLVIVLRVIWKQSRRGRLASHAKDRAHCIKLAKAAASQRATARRRVEKLEARPDKVPPKQLDDARGALQDAERLLEIRSDQLKVAENHLRQIIVEEYPPAHHARMRERYDLAEHAETRPFSFDG